MRFVRKAIPILLAVAMAAMMTFAVMTFGKTHDSIGAADVSPGAVVKPDTVTKAQVSETYGQLPLSFEANQGQTDAQVKFLSRGNGYTLFLTPTEVVLALRKLLVPTAADAEDIQATEYAVLRIHFIGANPEPEVAGLEELPGKSNYFIGNDPNKWQNDVPNYAKVRYQNIYPGVNLVYYGNQQQLEYDFVVAPGADPSVIRLGFYGADKVTIDDQDNLILHIAGGEVILNAPVIYQHIDGVKKAIPGGYVLQNNGVVGFRLGAYDTNRPLVIDPVLVYSTYLGGSSSDGEGSIAVDAQGRAYVTGGTYSTDFPTQNPYQGAKAGSADAFVTKLSASGDSLEYSTYLGGSSSDWGYGIAVDAQGSAYVTGYTVSTDFPTQNAYQGAKAGNMDAFVTKLSASGDSLEYSTYLGGSSSDWGPGIAVDAQGYAYVTGETESTNFPTQNPYQGANAGDMDAFVTKLSASGDSLEYSTYLGGSSSDRGHGIAVDAQGYAYVTGETSSTNFPTQNPYQGAKAGSADAFVTKLSASGDSLEYSTYLGGSSRDRGRGIAVDAQGYAYVTGETESTNFPTQNPYQGANAGDKDAFVTKLSASGSSLGYSTYLGGSSGDGGWGIAVDGQGSAYVTGTTGSTNFPTQNPYQGAYAGDKDAFVTKLSASGSSLGYSTYLGGSSSDRGHGIAVDAQGSAYVTGTTGSTNFPTQNPYQGAKAGSADAFVAKLSEPRPPPPPPPYVGAVGGEVYPVNKLAILALWIGSVMLVIGGITWFTLRRRKAYR